MAGKGLIFVSIFAVAFAFFGWKLTARGAYESAAYTVLDKAGRFEIRQYPDLTVAATTMRSESEGDDGSFMRLFRYIGGANNQGQKIAMTTPVFMESKSSDKPGQMGFVIPEKVAEQRAPEPTNDQVQIRKREGGRFAVIRFPGRINAKSRAKAETELRKWIKDKRLVGDGDAASAGYDPPWTPGPLRRNEVLIRLK